MPGQSQSIEHYKSFYSKKKMDEEKLLCQLNKRKFKVDTEGFFITALNESVAARNNQKHIMKQYTC